MNLQKTNTSSNYCLMDQKNCFHRGWCYLQSWVQQKHQSCPYEDLPSVMPLGHLRRRWIWSAPNMSWWSTPSLQREKSQRGQHLRFLRKHSFPNPLQQTARWESKPPGCWVGRCSPKPPGRFPRHGKAVPLFAAECDSLSWCSNRFHSNGFVILLRHS